MFVNTVNIEFSACCQNVDWHNGFLNRSNGFVCIMFPPIRKLLQGGGDMEKAENKWILEKRI